MSPSIKLTILVALRLYADFARTMGWRGTLVRIELARDHIQSL